MRVIIGALSIVAAVSSADVTLACSGNGTPYEATSVNLIEEPVLLNRENDSAVDWFEAAEEMLSPSWDDLDSLSSAVFAALDLGHLRVLVDDDGIPLIDVVYTGSSTTAPKEMALDGFEDR